uniref:Uncharacterized protein n=1 Tax=Arundo donax TaxID=35708 RepID=A0A0A9FPU3_ARUDO
MPQNLHRRGSRSAWLNSVQIDDMRGNIYLFK